MRRFFILTSALIVSCAFANETPSDPYALPVQKKSSEQTLSQRQINPNPMTEWNAPERTQLVYATPEPPGSQGFLANLEVGQVLGVNNSAPNFTEFLVEGSYRFNRRNEIGFGQEAKKLYQPVDASSGNSFLLNDTLVYYTGLIAEDLLSFEWKANVSITLPVSSDSQNVGRLTRTMAGLEISRKFFDNRISFRYQPAFSFYVNRNLTDPSGNPLHKMAFAQMADAKWDIKPKLISLNVWAQGFVYFYENYDNSFSSPSPSTELQWGSYVGVELAEFAQLQLGYLNGNTLIPDFRYDDNLSPAASSRLYAALKASF